MPWVEEYVKKVAASIEWPEKEEAVGVLRDAGVGV